MKDVIDFFFIIILMSSLRDVHQISGKAQRKS